MKMIDKIYSKTAWEEYYEYKKLKEPEDSKFIVELKDFIEEESYKKVADDLRKGQSFSNPEKIFVNKANSKKKRVVYTFSGAENFVLKFISYQLKKYDHYFAPNLYSFRNYKTVKKAWEYITRIPNLEKKYVYKLDISNYFGSVNVAKLLPIVKEIITDDDECYLLLRELLLNPYVVYEGEIMEEGKGILPGVPISAFLANVYLSDLDDYFYKKRVKYFRYSDDIIVFAEDEKELQDYIFYIKEFLKERELYVNTDKESVTGPNQKWEFLGFSYCNGTVDVSDIALRKLKAKMRRKSKALQRWAETKKIPKEYAARAFIKRFNAKLFENPIHNELTWTRWYFPVINTDKTLKIIDGYMQDCIRFLATGKRTKSRYNFTYEKMKELGYRNLVNEFYKSKEQE